MSDSNINQSQLFHFAPDALEGADRDALLRLVRAVVRVGGIIDSVHNLSSVLELIMKESEKAVDAETSSLLLYDPETNELIFEVAHGSKGDEVKKVRLPLDENSIAGTAAMNRSPVNVTDVREDSRWNWTVDEQTRFFTRNILAVPMMRQDRLIGILEVLNKKNGSSFSNEDINVLLLLGTLAAMAIENAQLYEKNIQAERLAALGQAVAGISHYVKNVLGGLEGSLTLVENAMGAFPTWSRTCCPIQAPGNRMPPPRMRIRLFSRCVTWWRSARTRAASRSILKLIKGFQLF